YYIVMEFLDGDSLNKTCMATGGRMADIRRAVKIMVYAADALAAAHEHGIVHRDMRPGNIFLTRRGVRTDYVKLMDFGQARLLPMVRRDVPEALSHAVDLALRKRAADRPTMAEFKQMLAQVDASAVMPELSIAAPVSSAGPMLHSAPTVILEAPGRSGRPPTK